MSEFNTNVCPSIYRGLVIDNDDPLGMGRCKIKVPSVYGNPQNPETLPWARPITIAPVNKHRGSVVIPQKGDVVWVLFEESRKEYPVYFGGTYSKDEVDIDKDRLDFYIEGTDRISYDRKTNEYTIAMRDTSVTVTRDNIILKGNVIIQGSCSVGGDILMSGTVGEGMSIPTESVMAGEKYSAENSNLAGEVDGGRELVFSKGGNFECPYSNVYTYMGWQMVTSTSSQQYKWRQNLYPDWENGKDAEGSKDAFDSEGFGVAEGRYVVATTPQSHGGIANIGEKLDVYLENGTILKCVVGDIKDPQDATWTKWGHRYGSSVSTIEFCVNRNGSHSPKWYDINKAGSIKYTHENPGTATCHPEWNSRIEKIVVGTKVIKPSIPSGDIEEKAKFITGGVGINRGSDTESFCSSLITTISVTCRGVDGNTYTKKLAVNKYLVDNISSIFNDIYTNTDFCIKSNSTGAYQYRKVNNGTGSNNLSYHSYGVAIDLNWDDNPFVRPKPAIPESDSNVRIRTNNHPVVQIFEKHGWGWGGNYKTGSDYMHFSYFNGS